MKKTVMVATVLAAMAISAEEARWISYPGDYGIWWGNRLQSERLQWGSRLTPFWPLYEPHNRVLFRKAVKLDADEELEVRLDGNASICYWNDKWDYIESSVLDGRFTLPKNATKIEIKIQNNARPPAVWVKGAHLVSDGDWKASWITTWDDSEDVYVDAPARFTDPATPPGLAKLPTVEKRPVWVKPYKTNHLLADFGEETYGYLRLKDVKGTGKVRIIYAESEPEMYAEHLVGTMKGALDGWEEIEVADAADFRRAIPHGFRYVHVIPAAGVTVSSVTMDYESKGVSVKGSFRCSDEELNKIWEVAVHTLDLTCREVFIEGVKRDHWVWSGDAVQSFLMNYYVFGDYDGCRDTLWTLRGKDPVKVHLNRIPDYTYYWFDAVERYELYSGDRHIASQVYPRMKSLLEWALARLDKDGRPADAPGDWVFIDWASKPLPNYGGVTSFEQMLLVRALEATAHIAEEVGEAKDAASYRDRAKKLRGEIVPRYWNAEKGGLMHLVKNDGSVDPMITRYPNMFGLFYGYFNDAEKESVVKNVMLNDDVLKIQTPYMRFYELEALCSLGMQENVTKEMKSYWGDMLRLGATSFWELYNPKDEGSAHYAMYDRDFGKSLCHAWGASPAYLLGRYYLGVTPTAPGFAKYEVKPALGGLDWIEGDVPAPFGKIHVRADKAGVSVKSEGGEGTLVLGDRRIAIPAGAEVKANW